MKKVLKIFQSNKSALVAANTKISKVPKCSIGTVVHVYKNRDAYNED